MRFSVLNPKAVSYTHLNGHGVLETFLVDEVGQDKCRATAFHHIRQIFQSQTEDVYKRQILYLRLSVVNLRVEYRKPHPFS